MAPAVVDWLPHVPPSIIRRFLETYFRSRASLFTKTRTGLAEWATMARRTPSRKKRNHGMSTGVLSLSSSKGRDEQYGSTSRLVFSKTRITHQFSWPIDTCATCYLLRDMRSSTRSLPVTIAQSIFAAVLRPRSCSYSQKREVVNVDK